METNEFLHLFIIPSKYNPIVDKSAVQKAEHRALSPIFAPPLAPSFGSVVPIHYTHPFGGAGSFTEAVLAAVPNVCLSGAPSPIYTFGGSGEVRNAAWSIAGRRAVSVFSDEAKALAETRLERLCSLSATRSLSCHSSPCMLYIECCASGTCVNMLVISSFRRRNM